jgi:hypothetical protein
VIFGGSSILGIAVGERAIACAEIGAHGGRRTVRRLASFAMGPNNAAEKPGELGQQLASFLRRNGFSASRVVVGVPAKWLIAVEKEVPPAGAEEVRAALRLQAERMSGATEGGELIFDYVGELGRSSGTANKVLLVGILRRQLERVQAIAEAAGLNVIGVTSSALALASSGSAENPEASTVVLGRQGAEVVWRHHGAPVMLRHVSVAGATNGHVAAAVGALGKELRRNVSLLKPGAAASNGHSSTGATREVALWDLMGLSSAEVSELSDRLGVQVRTATTEASLGMQVTPAVLAPESEPRSAGAGENGAATVEDPALCYAPAIALALAGSRRDLPVDLAHSRLAPPQERRFGRTGVWAAVLGALLVLALGALVWDVQARKSESAELKKQLADVDLDVKNAEGNVAKLTYGRGYFETRPPMLECLREITLAFREDEPIWVSSMNFRDTHAGQLNGKSTDQRFVLAVLDRMKKDPKFSDVKLLDMRDAGGKSKEIAFSISFNFEGDE